MLIWLANLRQHFIEDAWLQAKRLWSIRVALFWGAMCGLLLCWPALADQIPLKAYLAGGILIAASIAGARFLKQPGTEN